jgi:hypothetical protein
MNRLLLHALLTCHSWLLIYISEDSSTIGAHLLANGVKSFDMTSTKRQAKESRPGRLWDWVLLRGRKSIEAELPRSLQKLVRMCASFSRWTYKESWIRLKLLAMYVYNICGLEWRISFPQSKLLSSFKFVPTAAQVSLSAGNKVAPFVTVQQGYVSSYRLLWVVYRLKLAMIYFLTVV